jgi:Ala-tRNA(Pro) deacylase
MKPRPEAAAESFRRLPRNARLVRPGRYYDVGRVKLLAHLDRKQIKFDMVPHRRTKDAMSSAEACCISPDCLAKGVVLRASEGYFLTILPASQRISWSRLQRLIGEACVLATENELDQLFEDCAHGAIPPIGECYGLDVVVDASICDPPDVYFEGGDHATLVHLSQTQFAQLCENARFAHFAAALE